MGHPTTPRHRAEVPRTLRLANLRRDLAHLLAGRDLYADDRVLRPGAHDTELAAQEAEMWAAAVTPAARRTQPA